jgi:hypothetical protein
MCWAFRWEINGEGEGGPVGKDGRILTDALNLERALDHSLVMKNSLVGCAQNRRDLIRRIVFYRSWASVPIVDI